MSIPLTLTTPQGDTLATLTLTDAGIAWALEKGKEHLPAGISVKTVRTSDGTLRVEAGVPVLGEVVVSLALEAEPG